MDKQIFESWLATGTVKTGDKLFVTQAEWAALADLARDEILTLRQGGAAAAARPAASPAVKPAAVTQPAPAAKPATVAPVASNAALPAGAMTAEAFRASQVRNTMTRAEFDKLTHPERNAFMREGGKLSA